jgi:hypothetical protein
MTSTQQLAFIKAWIKDLPPVPPKLDKVLRKSGPKMAGKSRKTPKGKNPSRRSKRLSTPSRPSSPSPKRGRAPVRSKISRQNLGSLGSEDASFSSGRTMSSRSSSPTETRQDLESAVPRIVCREFSLSRDADMRANVESLRVQLINVARGRGNLPLSIKVGFQAM